MLNFGFNKKTSAPSFDFSVASRFISVKDGDYTDGATWGNASPGTYGKDFPGPEDTFEINHHVIVPLGKSVKSTGVIKDNSIFTIDGEFTLSTNNLLFGKNSKCSITGIVNLNGYKIKSSGFYNVYKLEAVSALINGPGGIESKKTELWGFCLVDAVNTQFRNLNGLHVLSNSEYLGADSYPIRFSRCNFDGCTGDFTIFGDTDRIGLNIALVEHSIFNSFVNIEFYGRYNVKGFRINSCEFRNSGITKIGYGWEDIDCTFINGIYRVPNENSKVPCDSEVPCDRFILMEA